MNDSLSANRIAFLEGVVKGQHDEIARLKAKLAEAVVRADVEAHKRRETEFFLTAAGPKIQRYDYILNHVSGVRVDGFPKFLMPHIVPVPGANIMQGSVAQHFEDAIDYAIKRPR